MMCPREFIWWLRSKDAEFPNTFFFPMLMNSLFKMKSIDLDPSKFLDLFDN